MVGSIEISVPSSVAAGAPPRQDFPAAGAVVQVAPSAFSTLLSKTPRPLVVVAQSGYRTITYQYLTGHAGMVFFTESFVPLQLPDGTEVIPAAKIFLPQAQE